MSKEMTDAEWLRALAGDSHCEAKRLISIANRLEQQENPVRDVPDIVRALERFIYRHDSFSFPVIGLATILKEHFENESQK